MKENVGRTDRWIRTAVGTALLGAASTRLHRSGASPMAMLSVIAATMLLESALTRVCPISTLIGIDTRTRREKVRDAETLCPEHGYVSAPLLQ